MQAVTFCDQNRGTSLLLFNSRLAYVISKNFSMRGIVKGFFFFKKIENASDEEIIEFPMILCGNPESFVLGLNQYNLIKPVENSHVLEMDQVKPKKDFLVSYVKLASLSFYDGGMRREVIAASKCNPREFAKGQSISAVRQFQPNVSSSESLVVENQVLIVGTFPKEILFYSIISQDFTIFPREQDEEI